MADGPNKVDRPAEVPVVVEDGGDLRAPPSIAVTSSQGETVTDDTVLRTAAGELDRLGALGDPSGELARSARLAAPHLTLDSPVPPARPRTDRSEPLTEFLGMIVAGLRLEHAGLLRLPYERILRMENLNDLREEIEGKIPITSASIDEDVHQSWDPDRSIVELSSNALDAGQGDIQVTVRNGFYEVLDTGCGMDAETIIKAFLVAKLSGKPDPSKTIGRFGMGFYTAYRHLQRAGDHLIVETKAEGSKAWRLHFFFHDGEIRLASQEISEEIKNGTRVRVFSGSIFRERMEAELDRYLRYVPDQVVWVNGKMLNQNERLVSLFSEGNPPPLRGGGGGEGDPEATLTLALSPQGRGDRGVVFNPNRRPGIAVQIGKVVIEQYPTTGHVLPGELVIQLSQEEGHSVARTEVVVNEKMAGTFKRVLDSVDGSGGTSVAIAFLNTLAPLAQAFDSNGRNQTETSFVDLLRRKVEAIVDKGIELYPDTEEMRELVQETIPPPSRGGASRQTWAQRPKANCALFPDARSATELAEGAGEPGATLSPQGRGDLVFVSPSILPHGWTTHFAVPPEFKSGKTIDTNRPDGTRQMQVVLSKNLEDSFFYDRTSGVLFISEKIYRQTPAVVWDAFFKIPNLRFEVSWGEVGKMDDGRVESVTPVKPDQPTAAASATPDRFKPEYAVLRLVPDGEKIATELERRGLEVPSVSLYPSEGDVGPLSDYTPFLYRGRVFVLQQSSVSSTENQWFGNFGRLGPGSGPTVAPRPGHTIFSADQVETQIVEDSGQLCFLVGDRMDVRYQRAYGPAGRLFYDVSVAGKLDPFYAGDRWLALKVREDGAVFLVGDGRPRMRKGVRRTKAPLVFDYKLKAPDGSELKVDWTAKGWKVSDLAGTVLLDFEGRYFRPVVSGGKLFFKGVKDYKVQDGTQVSGTSRRPLYPGRDQYSDRREWLNHFEMDNVFEIFEYKASEGERTASIPKISEFQAIDVTPHQVGDQTLLAARFHSSKNSDTWSDPHIDLVDLERQRFFGMEAAKPYAVYDGSILLRSDRGDRSGVSRSGVRYGNASVVVPEACEDICYRNGIFLLGNEDGRQIIVLEHLKKLTDPKYIDRLEAVKDRPMTDALYNALFNFSDASWEVYFKEDPHAPLQTWLAESPLFADYARDHLKGPMARMRRAFLLIKHLGAPSDSYFGIQKYRSPTGASHGLSIVNPDLFFKKIDQLVDGFADIDQLVDDLVMSRVTEETELIQAFIRIGDVDLILAPHSKIDTVSSKEEDLAIVVSSARLGATQEKPFELDSRLVQHQANHVNAGRPINFLRRLIQYAGSHPLPDPLPSRERGVRFDYYAVKEGESLGLHVSYQDDREMTAQEFVQEMIDPEQGNKLLYSILEGAEWVRIRTRLRDTSEIITVEMRPVRDAKGRIERVTLSRTLSHQGRGESKKEEFSGTLIETRRFSGNIHLQTAHVQMKLEDMAAYVQEERLVIRVNGKVDNFPKKPIATAQWNGLGKVELFDGLKNRILLDGVPVCELDPALWRDVPAPIREFFEREGFYLNLSSEKVRTIPTGDRFEDHEKVLRTIAAQLPGILIAGFLHRVTDPEKPEDLNRLPEVYFNSAYQVAHIGRFDRSVMDDAARLNSGDHDLDYGKYFDEAKLVQLLTLLEFIPHEGGRISIDELHRLAQQVIRGDSDVSLLLNRLAPQLPPSLSSRIEFAATVDETRRELNTEMDKRSKALGDKTFTSCKDPLYDLYLKLIRRLVRNYDGAVDVGYHTLRDHLSSTALSRDGEIFWTFNERLQDRIAQFHQIALIGEGAERKKEFLKLAGGILQTVTHELTHIRREFETRLKGEFTHDVGFYDFQMHLLVEECLETIDLAKLEEEFLEPAKGLKVKPWLDVLEETILGEKKRGGPLGAAGGGVNLPRSVGGTGTGDGGTKAHFTLTEGALALQVDVIPPPAETMTGSPLQTFAQGGDDNKSPLRDRLAVYLAARNLRETAAFVMRLSEQQIRLILRSGKTGAVRLLRKLGESSLADQIESGALKISGREISLLLLAACAKAPAEIVKVSSLHHPNVSGVGIPFPAVLATPSVARIPGVVGILR